MAKPEDDSWEDEWNSHPGDEESVPEEDEFVGVTDTEFATRYTKFLRRAD